jgi:hypothetical protein
MELGLRLSREFRGAARFALLMRQPDDGSSFVLRADES